MEGTASSALLATSSKKKNATPTFPQRTGHPSKVRAKSLAKVELPERSVSEAEARRFGNCRGCREGFRPMDGISAFAGLITSLRSAVEITKAIMDIGNTSTLQTKILDLTKEIMSAQSCALATQSAQLELSQSKRGLEDEVAKLKAWNMEKYRYELQTVGSGAVAYVLKQSMRGTEPNHWICANCFQIGKKRFLNESHSDLHFVYHKCQECAGKIRIRKAPQASEPDLGSFESVATSTSGKMCERLQKERMSSGEE
jgi:hypothetical protein